jgi:hypothetical protein
MVVGWLINFKSTSTHHIMKYISLLFATLFFMLCTHAQSARADVSITSVTLEGREHPWTPKTIAVPKNQNEATNVPANPREIKVPAREKPLPPYMKCTITVQNGAGNDAAQEVMVLLVLPGEVAGGSNYQQTIAKKISPNSPHPGHIQFNLGQLPAGQSKTVDFTFNSSQWFPNKVSAFVVASSSDPNPGNNYRETSY